MTKHKPRHEAHRKKEHVKHEHKKKKDQIYLWKISTFVLLAAFLVSAYFAVIPAKTSEVKAIQMSQVCSAADVEKAIDFINQNFVRAGTRANVINYSSQEMCWITTEYQGNRIPIILKEGSVLVLPYNVIDIEETQKRLEEQRKQIEQQIEKTEKPEVKLFIMSFCPYGRQAAESMVNVYNLLKDKADINVHYVIYPSDYYKGREEDYCIDNYCSMHGIKELTEDVREMCIAKLYGWDMYWKYMAKQLKECNLDNINTCWMSVAQNVGVDTVKIEACVKANATAYLKEEYELNRQYGVSASPTIFINNVSYTGERTPEAFKQAICNAFVEAPEECSQELSQTTSTPSGSCG